MQRYRLTTPLAVLALAVSGIFLTVPAQAATTKKVTLAVPVPIVGTTFDVNSNGGDPADDFVQMESVHFTFHWTVTVPSGICSQTFISDQRPDDGGNYSETTLGASVRSFKSAQEWSQYGPPKTTVTVHYCNGPNVVSNVIRPDFDTVVDDNGGFESNPDPAPSYNGAWALSNCACAAFRTTHYSTQKKASFSFRLWSGSFGIVMSRAPNRGSAELYVDGVKKVTINTYSKTASNSTFVYSAQLAGNEHTIKVVNLATAGHPRIDIDAVVGTFSH